MKRRTKYGRRTWGRAAELGLDPEGGPWVVICEDHHTCINVDLAAQARTLHTFQFCNECDSTD